MDENMIKKFDTKSNRNNDALEFVTFVEDYDFIICEILTHRRPV